MPSAALPSSRHPRLPAHNSGMERPGGVPAAGGTRPSYAPLHRGPPPSNVVRHRAPRWAPISAPPPPVQGHAHWRAQVPRPVGPSGGPDWRDRVLKSQWWSRMPPTTPLPRRGRATAPSLWCALQAPRPLRARCSLRPLPPVTCAARMWLGADVGSRCGPSPAHPRGRSAHTEPRRARRLSRLPQCTVELRPQLAGVAPNIAARHP